MKYNYNIKQQSDKSFNGFFRTYFDGFTEHEVRHFFKVQGIPSHTLTLWFRNLRPIYMGSDALYCKRCDTNDAVLTVMREMFFSVSEKDRLSIRANAAMQELSIYERCPEAKHSDWLVDNCAELYRLGLLTITDVLHFMEYVG